MSPQEIEATTIRNALAIEKLTGIVGRTSEDIDKVVKHLDAMLPLKTELDHLKDRVESLESSRTKWAWYVFSALSTIIGTLIYVIKDLVKLGVLGS